MMNFAEILIEYRKHLGWDQSEAAEKLNITNVHLSNLEKGKSTPSIKLIEKVEEVYGVNIYVLAWHKKNNRKD